MFRVKGLGKEGLRGQCHVLTQHLFLHEMLSSGAAISIGFSCPWSAWKRIARHGVAVCNKLFNKHASAVMCDAQIWYKLGTRIILGLPMLSTPSQCLHQQAPIELTCRLLQVVARCPWHAKMPEVPISGQK